MKKKSRQGAALVYVITVTAVLMILVTGLVFLAGINLHSSQTSLAARQAYLDAKSAVEYGRAYVSLYAQQEKQQAENGMTLKGLRPPAEQMFTTLTKRRQSPPHKREIYRHSLEFT